MGITEHPLGVLPAVLPLDVPKELLADFLQTLAPGEMYRERNYEWKRRKEKKSMQPMLYNLYQCHQKGGMQLQ